MNTQELQEALTAVQAAIAGLKDAAQKDAVLRACLSLNSPAYRAWFNCDPKLF
jgi:hypothetical protein